MFDCFKSDSVIALPLDIQALPTIQTKTGNVAVLDIIAVNVVLLIRYRMSRLPHRNTAFLLR